MCPRGDLNTETGEISPDRGNHAIRVTGAGRRDRVFRGVFAIWPPSGLHVDVLQGLSSAAGCGAPRARRSWATRAGRATFRAELEGDRARRRSAGSIFAGAGGLLDAELGVLTRDVQVLSAHAE